MKPGAMVSLVAQTFLSAGFGDLQVASPGFMNTGLESPVNPQTGMSALHDVSIRQPFGNHRRRGIIAGFFGPLSRDVCGGDHREVFFRREPHDEVPHGV
jgi:hypothetical protein